MLIGLEKRFVFIANTKTGSTSIEQALAPHADFRHGGTPKRKHNGIRDALTEYRSVFSQPGNEPETFLKFGVMRDPVDWIVSWFRYRKRAGEHPRLPIDMTLEEFWERRDWTFQNQEGVKNLQKTRFTSETGEVLMDRIIPFPELAPQFAAICDSLGIEIPLPKANVSKIRASDVPIPVNLRREIEQFFEEDYELYNRLDELNARPAPTRHKAPISPTALGPAVNYMFLFAPNNSGTTIMSQYIASQIGGYLPPYGNNEGHSLPELREIMKTDRWVRTLEGEWPKIRQVFDTRRENAVFIEASPPNIRRVGPIRREFDGAARYLFSICNPYQYVASCVFNYFRPPVDLAIDKVASKWVERAAIIQRAMAGNPDIPFLSYETFCDDPTSFNRLFGLETTPVSALQGKANTQLSEIRNLAARTISFLSESEIDRVTKALLPHRELVEFFGYRLKSGAELLESFADQDSEISIGMRRRADWSAKTKSGKAAG